MKTTDQETWENALKLSKLSKVQRDTLCSLANTERTLSDRSRATVRKLYHGDWIDFRHLDPSTYASASRPRLKVWRLTQKGCDAVAEIWKREQKKLAELGLRADQLRVPPTCFKYDRDMA